MDLRYLLLLQQFRESAGELMTSFMMLITNFAMIGSAVLCVIIFWTVDKVLGYWLISNTVSGLFINNVIKLTACVYRPWIRDPRIIPDSDALATATGYSFPSGHSMNGASLFGGAGLRKELPRGTRIVLFLIMAFIAFSRNYLGVHTPQDVIVGTTAGLLVMWLTGKLLNWVEAHPEKDILVLVIGGAIAAAVAIFAALKPYPVDYNAEGKLLVDGAKMANDTFKGVGYCAAFLIGWILERRYVGFTTDIPLPRKLSRAVIGLLGFYAVSLILNALLKSWISGPVGTTLSCFLQILYIVFLFPLCAKHFEREDTAAAA